MKIKRLERKLKKLYGHKYKLYGPYVSKDKRKRIILNNGKQQKCLSLAKAKLEVKLERRLISGETADHIDEDKTNDSSSNLQVKSNSKNNIKSLNHRFGKPRKCKLCNKQLVRRTKAIRKRRAKHIFCSGSCRSQYYGNRHSRT